jgi:uncharacterized protein DUF2608
MFSKRELKSVIQESKTIKDILQHCSFDSLVVFDLDNTIIRPTHVEDLGSDQWFCSLFKHAIEALVDPNEARLLAVALSDYIQSVIDVKLVEAETVGIIKKLQAIHIPVLGLTARGLAVADITQKQLDKVDVHFTPYGEKIIKLDIGNSERDVYFKDGIIFCDGADKGKCLMEFFKVIGRSFNVIMVDDAKKNLSCVQEAIKQKKISFVGLRYGVMDQRAKSFCMFRAMKKYTDIKHILPEKAREIVEKLQLVEKVRNTLKK